MCCQNAAVIQSSLHQMNRPVRINRSPLNYFSAVMSTPKYFSEMLARVPSARRSSTALSRASRSDVLSVPLRRGKATREAMFLHLALVQAKVSHAKILSIDTSEAEKMPGVARVLTAKDVQGTNRIQNMNCYSWDKGTNADRPILCDDKVYMYLAPCDPEGLLGYEDLPLTGLDGNFQPYHAADDRRPDARAVDHVFGRDVALLAVDEKTIPVAIYAGDRVVEQQLCAHLLRAESVSVAQADRIE